MSASSSQILMSHIQPHLKHYFLLNINTPSVGFSPPFSDSSDVGGSVWDNRMIFISWSLD